MEQFKLELEKRKNLLKQASQLSDKKYFKYAEMNNILEKNENLTLEKLPQVLNPKESSGPILISTIDNLMDNKPLDREEAEIPSRKEVITQLRQRNQAIRLFGETDYQAYLRLKNIEFKQPEMDKGFTNDFQQAMQKMDQEMDDNVGSSSKSKQDACDVKISDDNTTIEELLKISKELGKGDIDLDSQIIHKYLKFIVKCWGRELNNRPLMIKASYRGKMTAAQYSQTRGYLKPLMNRLKKRSLQADILENMADIVKNALARDYIKANEGYLRMAIGNAPWPIGVTMPGIHVRTGRERIASRHVAHVLNDETQRKYIQGLKRILTANQRIFPADPSKSIEYSGLLGLEL